MPQAVYPEVDSGSEPIRAGTKVPPASCLTLLPMGFAKPAGSPRLLVSSYLTVSPLPPLSPVGGDGGGLLSAALSLALRPVGVTDHRALRSPDFPPICLTVNQRPSVPLLIPRFSIAGCYGSVSGLAFPFCQNNW